MKDTTGSTSSNMPDASHPSFIRVYRIEAFFPHHFFRKLSPPTTLLINYYNTRTLLMLCRSRSAFDHCSVLLQTALCSIYVRRWGLTVDLSTEAGKANSVTFAIVRLNNHEKRQDFRRYARVLVGALIHRIKVLCTGDQLRRSAALSLNGCIKATCDPPSLAPFIFKYSDSSAWPFVKIVSFLNVPRFQSFGACREFCLLGIWSSRTATISCQCNPFKFCVPSQVSLHLQCQLLNKSAHGSALADQVIQKELCSQDSSFDTITFKPCR